MLTLGILLACCPCASALDPSLDISQYAHTSWTIRDGFVKGRIAAIAQTPDGYVWLGTEFGLLRFDGVRAVPWQPPAGEHLPSSVIRSLLAARDGTLWIGTFQGLASWKDGKLTQYQMLAGRAVGVLLEDHEGTVWANGFLLPSARLCAIRAGATQCYGEDGRFGQNVDSVYEDTKGNLWVGARTGLWRLKPGPQIHYAMPRDASPYILGMTEDSNGTLVVSARGGVKQLVSGKADAYPLSGVGRQFTPNQILRDHDGGIWIGTNEQGLLHVHQGRTDVFAKFDGLSGDAINALFEDREGNIWVSTLDGLDRFRDFAVPSISVPQGLSNNTVGSVLAAADGSVWLGTLNGLNQWKDGKITIYRNHSARAAARTGTTGAVRDISESGLPDDGVDSVFQDDHGQIWISSLHGVAYFENGRFSRVAAVPSGFVHSFAQDNKGHLWINHQDGGLLELSGDSLVDQIPWARLGHDNVAMTVLPDAMKGGLWLGFWYGGVAYLKDGQVRASYAATDGLGEGHVMGLQLDSDGTLWAATQGGLSRIKDGHVATLASKNGLPCDTVHWMMEDNSHSVWLYTACGLVRVARSELDAWAANPKHAMQPTVFDSSDGVRTEAVASVYSPRVAKSADGKLWFVSGDGVSVIDPRHIPVNTLPPPVHVEQITADRKTYWQNFSGDASSSQPRLPPLVRDLEIDYTALSFVAPEKNRFRVKLEGWDRDWQDVGNRRQAFYNNLSPGNYRFRVTASNNSGVWNEAGTSLDFSIAPAYYQTNWFRATCIAAFMLLLWGLYRLRLRQMAQQFNVRMEERVGERTRIARDLHDTLLQSFHGLLLRFQTVSNELPPGDTKEKLDSAIDQAAEAITEGRDAVQGLRSSTVETNDLALAIRAIGEELAADAVNGHSVEFRVQVEGAPRNLHPILRDEVYRIAGEALRNAFRHAQAHQIEVEIRYDERQLRLRIRDDGKGIDQEFLKGGEPAGHFGLHGMRERAKLLGGKLTVWSELDSGTEVELSIPAAHAYEKSGATRSSWLSEMAGKLSGKGTALKS